MNYYKLKKQYESPTSVIASGVIKSEKYWLNIFPDMEKGDCNTKTDWFENMGEQLTDSGMVTVEKRLDSGTICWTKNFENLGKAKRYSQDDFSSSINKKGIILHWNINNDMIYAKGENLNYFITKIMLTNVE